MTVNFSIIFPSALLPTSMHLLLFSAALHDSWLEWGRTVLSNTIVNPDDLMEQPDVNYAGTENVDEPELSLNASESERQPLLPKAKDTTTRSIECAVRGHTMDQRIDNVPFESALNASESDGAVDDVKR